MGEGGWGRSNGPQKSTIVFSEQKFGPLQSKIPGSAPGLSANQRALMLMSTMSSLNISISISIRKKLTLMLMLRLSSLAHKLLMLKFMLMLVSLVRTGLNSAISYYNKLQTSSCNHTSWPWRTFKKARTDICHNRAQHWSGVHVYDCSYRRSIVVRTSGMDWSLFTIRAAKRRSKLHSSLRRFE